MAKQNKLKALEEGILKKDKISIARAISLIEDDFENAKKLLKNLDKYTGKAHIIGITGAPGSGKSSLINLLAKEARKNKEEVGILLIDPTSPFTSGAILGDRIRMSGLANDEGLYIRSMATRGNSGGLSKAAYSAAKILDAASYKKIIIETVGVGQDEVDIFRVADTSVVVLTPQSGDDVQALKAGLMEIADMLVVNKIDLDIGKRMKTMLESVLEKKLEIYETSTTQNKGILELYAGINKHLSYLKENNLLEKKQKERIRFEITQIVKDRINSEIEKELGKIESKIGKVYKKETNVYSVAEKISKKISRT